MPGGFGMVPTLKWEGEVGGHLVLLDQTRLPLETVEVHCRTVEEAWDAIKRLVVRGAPAIGVAAAYAVCLTVKNGQASVHDVVEACRYLATSRPTAVNLFWALARMRRVAEATTAVSGPALAEALLA